MIPSPAMTEFTRTILESAFIVPSLYALYSLFKETDAFLKESRERAMFPFANSSSVCEKRIDAPCEFTEITTFGDEVSVYVCIHCGRTVRART